MIKNLITRSLILVIFCLFTLEHVNAQETFDIKVFLDTESAGWAFKSSDHAFLVETEGCRIKWNAVKKKDGGMYLSVRRNCDLPFVQQAPVHRAILREINERWKISEFKYILWGSFCNRNDWSWCIPIAQASLQSDDYIDYCKNYPDSKLKNVNSLFVKITNKTNSYKELSGLVADFGVILKLKRVDKVFSTRLEDAPFFDALKDLGIKDNPRILFNAGMTYFYLY